VKAAAIALLAFTLSLGFTPWPTWLGMSGFYLIFAFLLPAAFHGTRENRFDRWFGEFSYLIYIVHLVLLNTVALVITFPESRILVFGAVLTLLCLVLRVGVEDPISKWRLRRFGT